MMKFSLAALLALGLGACAVPVAEEPVSQGASAVEPLVGKRLVAENGTVFIFNADGTVGGSLGGSPVIGAYTATASQVCSTYSSPENLTGQEFCSVPNITDDTVIFDRPDGSQSQLYSIEG